MKAFERQILREYLTKRYGTVERSHRKRGEHPAPCLGPIVLDDKAAMVVLLTKGHFAVIDAADHETIRDYNWSTMSCSRDHFYACRANWANGKGLLLAMHRQIMNAPNGLEIDHIDGDGFDNRRANLRACTHRQNQFNKRGYASSGFKGVYKRKSGWAAHIKEGDIARCIGIYPTPLDAACAYNEAAIRVHGEFARLNEIQREERLCRASAIPTQLHPAGDGPRNDGPSPTMEVGR